MPTTRRSFLAQSLGAAGLLCLNPLSALARPSFVVPNVSQLYPVEVARIAVPESTEQVAREVRAWDGKVAIGGGRYSMGGQTAVALGLHLDMRRMNRLLHFDPVARTVRVQAGVTWRDLQDTRDPAGLAVKSMQRYSNFTVGGAVSVNAHGRYTGTGPAGSTVRALRMVLADGAIVDASPGENTELFRAAVGGYGAVGVIAEVKLDLTENCRIERHVVPLTLDRYRAYFTRQVRDAPDVVMHNADLLPPHFDAPVAVSWRRTGKALTETARLVPRGQRYRVSQAALQVATEAPYGDLLVRLQEYFIPVARFEAFAREMAAVIRAHGAQVLNVSVRHAKADPVPLLPWAKEEVFSFVVYYKQQTSAVACAAVGEWTRAMIASALRHGGRYCLPYQLHATRAQFEQAYLEVDALRRATRALDPDGKFSNTMWARHL